ncbi:MAG: PorP/SprF family type IX secretion system membrane protein, partial [Flavobacteriales bacterium]
MKKIIFAATSLLLCTAAVFNSSNSFAQQDAQYSMYMFNPLSVNAAYAGSRDALSVTLLGRQQWVNIDGAPTTGTISIHTPLKYEAVSVGLSVIQDEIGPTQNTGIYGDVSYRFKLTNNSRLAFGLKA